MQESQARTVHYVHDRLIKYNYNVGVASYCDLACPYNTCAALNLADSILISLAPQQVVPTHPPFPYLHSVPG